MVKPWESDGLGQGGQTLPGEDQMINILGFMVTVSSTQLCLSNTKATTDGMEMSRHNCVPKNLYLLDTNLNFT